MPKRDLAPEYRDDYLVTLRSLLRQPADPHMVRLWTNQDGSRTDVQVFIASPMGSVLNITPHIGYLMNEPLWLREPAGWALRLSSGGVNPGTIIGYALGRLLDTPNEPVRVVGA